MLHIPEGIRFDCTGCGNCCLEWPVPATDEDVQRIRALKPEASFRALQSGDGKMRGFTHTLEKQENGRCAFLNEDNRCGLHTEHGIDAKPGMCQLFPYSFTPTPSGTYMYLSFASSGVLSNSGRLLTEQREEMEKQFALFQKLFPNVDADWSRAQLHDGAALDWDAYVEFEQSLLQLINTHNSVLDALIDCSRILQKHIPPGAFDHLPKLEASAKTADQLILKALDELYWPPDVFAENSFDLNARELLKSLVNPPSAVTICGGTRIKTFVDAKLGELPEGAEDLLRRFIYCRIFGKLYFGRSFAHLSLLAGIHHLFFLTALIRLHCKAKRARNEEVSFWTVAELIRTMERRLTQMNFSRESCATLEILLSSPSRLERIKLLCL